MAVLVMVALMTTMNADPEVGLLLLLQPSAHIPASITATEAFLRLICCLQGTWHVRPRRQRSRRGAAWHRRRSYHCTIMPREGPPIAKAGYPGRGRVLDCPDSPWTRGGEGRDGELRMPRPAGGQGQSRTLPKTADRGPWLHRRGRDLRPAARGRC